MKTSITIKIIFLISIISIFTIGNCLATNGWDIEITPNSDLGSDNDQKIVNAGNQIIGIIQMVGVAIAVVMLIMLGIKYMIAKKKKKADIKKTATIYIIGAVILFGASGILQIIKNVVTGQQHIHDYQEVSSYTQNGRVVTVMRCTICGAEEEFMQI